MREIVLERMCCAVCRGQLRWRTFRLRSVGVIDEGVAWCVACGHWYPIEDGLLELLPPALSYAEDRQRFQESHHAEFQALGQAAGKSASDTRSVQAQRKQQEHFDWYARNDRQSYDAFERLPFWSTVDERVFRDWRQEVRPDGWLLDVGCAQGRATFQFMDLPLQLVGFDVSKGLVREAIQRYRRRPCRARASFFAGDASSLPFVADTFDHVLVYGVLHHLPDPAHTAREVARVLKPGGVYFGFENNPSVFRCLFDLLMSYRPAWYEEAGAQPLIGARDLRAWFAETPVQIATSTQVFLPPHLVNLLGRRWGGRLLNLTDAVGRAWPLLRNHGGLIQIRGQRAA